MALEALIHRLLGILRMKTSVGQPLRYWILDIGFVVRGMEIPKMEEFRTA